MFLSPPVFFSSICKVSKVCLMFPHVSGSVIGGECEIYRSTVEFRVGTCAYDLVADLHSWAVRARPGLDRLFFSYQNEWTLSYDTLSRAIKLVAKQMGLNPARFRTHSLRIGGASMMAAAGRPDYEIMKLGRWKSLAFLGYM
jgi:hypothetical protein